jgi:hypothetical protein
LLLDALRNTASASISTEDAFIPSTRAAGDSEPKTTQKVIKVKLGLVELAKQFGTGSQVCILMPMEANSPVTLSAGR